VQHDPLSRKKKPYTPPTKKPAAKASSPLPLPTVQEEPQSTPTPASSETQGSLFRLDPAWRDPEMSRRDTR
jgi:hypothetical protein